MRELYIAVDIEATGPVPGKYSMYEFGAVMVDFPDHSFEAQIALLNDAYELASLQATNTSIDHLCARKWQDSPEKVMENFERWVLASASFHCARPVLVAINAPFDWMFIAYYFHTYLGRNPFGHSALDLKAYFAGKESCAWNNANKRSMEALYGGTLPHTHRGIDDAQKVAELFRLMRHNTL